MSTISIQFISDFTCPYCYVERHALLEAVKDFDVEIQWLPFENSPLNKPRANTYHDPVLRQHYRRTLVPMCKKLHLDMKLPPKVVPRPYTNLAFQGYYYADLCGKGEEFSNRILTAYYQQEQDIGKIDILSSLAGEIGLDQNDFSQALQNGRNAKAVEQIEQYVIETIRPKTLPTILLGDTIRLDGGVYTVEQLKQFLSETQNVQNEIAISGIGCSENGCGFDGYGI